MRRWAAMTVYGAGWILLIAAVVAPLAGVAIGLGPAGRRTAYVYGVPGHAALLVRSLTLSAVATAGALLLGLMPAAVLGAARGRRMAILTGLVLAPLLIPPQVFAYAWQIALAPQSFLGQFLPPAGGSWIGGAVKAGIISAAWLWPVATLIVAAGWRSAGQSVYASALLDTTPAQAFFRAVLPSLRSYLLAAGCLVAAVTLVEYAIPFLSWADVYATALQTLVDMGAPPRQILTMAGCLFGLVAAAVALAAWSLRGMRKWQPLEGEEGTRVSDRRRASRTMWIGSAAVWLASVGLPATVMLAWLQRPGAWQDGFVVFKRAWLVSLMVSIAAGALTVTMAMATTLLRSAAEDRQKRIASTLGMGLALSAALIPPAALGKGFVLFYNRPYTPGALGLAAGALGDVYERTPMVWILGLAARYSAVPILIAWLAVGRRRNVIVEQARADGADRFALLAWVLAPAARPSLLAAGMIVTVLSLFEVVLSQMLSPVEFPAIAQSILNQMHYGRDDMVITTSLIVMVAGILFTQACGWLLMWRRR